MDIARVRSTFGRIGWVDAGLVVLVVVVAQLDTWTSLLGTNLHGPVWLAFLVLTTAGLLMTSRRRRPFTTAVALSGLVMAWWLVEGTPPVASAVTIALLIASYSLGRWEPDRRRGVAGAVLIGLVLTVHLLGQPHLTVNKARDELPWSLVLLGAWLLGAYLRYRSLYVRQLRDSATHAERVRIARDLHDVVAHGVSVMVIQAEAAEEMLFHKDPGRAASSMRSVQDTGRQTLTDLRATLGTLRAPGAAERTPGPTLAHLDALTEQVRATGVDVNVQIKGDVRALSPGVNLVAYRVVQEALTNIIKHSTALTARVALIYRPDDVAVEVLDDGPARDSSPTSTGAGLVGMAERVANVGGELDTGPVVGGGFAVRARLPTVRSESP